MKGASGRHAPPKCGEFCHADTRMEIFPYPCFFLGAPSINTRVYRTAGEFGLCLRGVYTSRMGVNPAGTGAHRVVGLDGK